MTRVAIVLRVLLFSFLAFPAVANEVELTFEQTLTLRERPVPYTLDLTLTELAPTRIGVEALLDLSSVQAALSSMMDGYVVAETCALRAEIRELELRVREDTFQFVGVVEAQFYQCARDGLQATDRGALVLSQALSLQAQAAIRVAQNCAALSIPKLELRLEGAIELPPEDQERIQAASGVLVAAAERFFARHPVCPKLPEQLRSLSPRYDAGGTREIGDGGAGVALQGSVDVSTQTILSVMQELQSAGILPPAP